MIKKLNQRLSERLTISFPSNLETYSFSIWFKFLDGATSVHSFLKAYKTSKTKGFFPYERCDSADKLENEELHLYEAFLNKLRSNSPLSTDSLLEKKTGIPLWLYSVWLSCSRCFGNKIRKFFFDFQKHQSWKKRYCGTYAKIYQWKWSSLASPANSNYKMIPSLLLSSIFLWKWFTVYKSLPLCTVSPSKKLYQVCLVSYWW